MAIYHFTTKNKSFLKMALFYKELGCKNYNFLLRLNNPALLYVDPWDPNLDLPTKVAIQKEVSENIWYFMRECVRVPTGGGMSPFIAHRANIAIIFTYILNLNTYVILPRQTNKTTTVLLCYLWDFYYGSINTEFSLFSYKESVLKDNMDKFRSLRDSLPPYLQLNNSKYDRENVREIRFNLGEGKYNSINYIVAATSEDKAKLVGRGSSKPRMMFDEVAFINHIRIQYGVTVYAFLTVANAARKNKSSYGITMMTTAGYLNEDHGIWAYQKLQEAARFDESLYDMYYVNPRGDKKIDRQQIIEYMLNNSLPPEGVKQVENQKRVTTEFSAYIKIEFMWYEMGYTEEWLEERRSMTSDDDFRREILMQWQDATTNHPYGQERVRDLQGKIIKPISTIVIGDVYILNLYRDMTEYDWNIPYILGMDSGSNIGNDFSTLVALDPTNYEVVAVMRTNQLSAPKFARAVAYIMKNIFTNSILIPERNSIGGIVIQIIMESLPFEINSRVYSDNNSSSKEIVYGVHLTQSLRDLFFNDILRNAIINEKDKIHDEYIIREITTLRFTKHGRVDHQEGCHDDTLIAYLYTRWFLLYCDSKNKYIDPIIIGSRLNINLGIQSGLIDLYPKLDKNNGLEYKMREVFEFQDNNTYKSHRDKMREQYNFINRDIRENSLDEEAIKDIGAGKTVDMRDVFFRKLENKYNDKSEELNEVSEYRTKENISSNYEETDLESEPEKIEKEIKVRKEKEKMSEETMRSSLSSIFGKNLW